MTNIWRMLVKDSRSAVDQHFSSILRELLKEMGGRLWRNREAASLALADLLQGRRWQEVKDHLEQIWTMAFRAIDDIKVPPCFMLFLQHAALVKFSSSSATHTFGKRRDALDMLIKYTPDMQTSHL